MKHDVLASITTILMLAAGIFLTNGVTAQTGEQNPSDRQQTRQAQAVSKRVYDVIQEAQKKAGAEDFDGALQILRKLHGSAKLTDYENSNVLNNIGLVQYSIGQTSAAIRTFEEILRIDILEMQIRKSTLRTLAQLNMLEDQHLDAVRFLEEWFSLEQNPSENAYILYARILYELARYDEMIEPIELAIAMANDGENNAKEDWYLLLSYAYFKQEDFQKVRDIQKILLTHWPNRRYWFTLAGAFTELGNETNVLASYDIAHTQGLLTEESQLITMAQLYLQHEVPYKAAVLLETEMNNGNVTRISKKLSFARPGLVARPGR